MFISKKHQVKDIEVIYTDLTRTYLDSIKKVVSEEDLYKFQGSCFLISEGYRYSMCLALGLDSEPASEVVKKYSSEFKNILEPLCLKYNLNRLSDDTKRGILEACVHCIEKSRKLVSC